jgi:hypothetical protein
MRRLTQRRHRQVTIFLQLALPAMGLAACGGGAPGPKEAARHVTLTGRGEGGNPAPLGWVVWRDGGDGQGGDGVWQAMAGAGGVYGFDPPSGRYTVAFVCTDSTFMGGEVIAATVDELSGIDVPCPGLQPVAPVHRWHGGIKGLAPDERVEIALGSREGGAFAGAVSDDRTSYDIDVLPPGTYDLAAAARDPAGGTRLLVVRDIVVAGDGATDLDFASATRKAHDQPDPRIAADATESLSFGSYYTSPRGARIDFVPPTGNVALLDPADLAPGDSQQFWVDARGPEETFRGIYRAVAGGPLPPLALPPLLTHLAVTPALGASAITLRPAITFDPYPGALFYQAAITTGQPNALPWVMNVGADWLGTGAGFELPDLSGVAGFVQAWGPRPDQAQAVEMIAIRSTRAFAPVLHDLPPPGPGAETSYAKKVITLQPPR